MNSIIGNTRVTTLDGIVVTKNCYKCHVIELQNLSTKEIRHYYVPLERWEETLEVLKNIDLRSSAVGDLWRGKKNEVLVYFEPVHSYNFHVEKVGS